MKKKMIVLSVLAAMAGLTAAHAFPVYGHHITYYDDANWSNVVGEHVLLCGTAGSSSWGSTTSYQEVDIWPCDLFEGL